MQAFLRAFLFSGYFYAPQARIAQNLVVWLKHNINGKTHEGNVKVMLKFG